MAAMTLTSTGFRHEEPIPSKFTCEGQNVSPELSWSGLPESARALVLICDDPDAPDPKAPKMTWVHWVLYNIPVSCTSLPEAVAASALPQGTRQGINDWKRTGYGGPCPPIGQHRYYFKLYAVDRPLPDMVNATKADIEKAMEGHILGQTVLMGTYQKAG
jgi:hypothetical protein